MKKEILDIPQNTAACNFLSGREWNGCSWNKFDRPTFAEIAAKFPELVKPEDTRVDWGSGHYCADENGMPKILRSCFDTSG
jgi:hypothetical protein